LGTCLLFQNEGAECWDINLSIYFLNNKNNSHFCYKKWRELSVELAALHAAAKNIINLTARTGGMYGGGRPAPFSPSVGCDVLRSTAAVSWSTASEDNGQRVAVILRVASADESWFYAACDNCLKGF